MWNDVWDSYNNNNAGVTEWRSVRVTECFLVFARKHMETLFYHITASCFQWREKQTELIVSLLKYPHPPPPPSQEQLIERSDTLLCCIHFLFFSFGSLFSSSGCQRRPPAPSCGRSFCCLSDPAGRISPGPGDTARTAGGEDEQSAADTKRQRTTVLCADKRVDLESVTSRVTLYCSNSATKTIDSDRVHGGADEEGLMRRWNNQMMKNQTAC